MKPIAMYVNGNTHVTIYEDGTKVRRYEGAPTPVFPESIDIKITNYCDLFCTYCHEDSWNTGRHGELPELARILDGLPAGVELAIGGGNPLAHPALPDFLYTMKKRGLICNLTVNQAHLSSHKTILRDLILMGAIKGLGISVSEYGLAALPAETLELRAMSAHIVFHMICGVHQPSDLRDLLTLVPDAKVLLLGYKRVGRGARLYKVFPEPIEQAQKEWAHELPSLLGKCDMAFDNLALQQACVRAHVDEKVWEKFYMGDDGQFTMYIDAVEKVYAKSSRDVHQDYWADMTLQEFFQSLQKKCVQRG